MKCHDRIEKLHRHKVVTRLLLFDRFGIHHRSTDYRMRSLGKENANNFGLHTYTTYKMKCSYEPEDT